MKSLAESIKMTGAEADPADVRRSRLSVESHISCLSALPAQPWLERNWEKSSHTYEQLRALYSGYFDRIRRAEGEEKALLDLVLCQLNSFVAVDVLLERKLLLLLVNSYAQTTERYIHRPEFISLMFFLSFASKEQIEEAVFDIVSAGQSRVTVGQLVHMHTHRMQRRLSAQVINLISECDRSGCGLLDVYDFRLLIGKLQEMEQQSTQMQLQLEEERAKLEEALLEAHELQTWSWNILSAQRRTSQELTNLYECRELLSRHPAVAESLSRLVWDYPEILSVKFVQDTIHHCRDKSASIGSTSLSDEDSPAVDSLDELAISDAGTDTASRE